MILVYQAYGRKEIYDQTVLSVSSLYYYLQKNDDLQVWIYTDDPSYFETYFTNIKTLKLMKMTDEKLKEWRGDINFVHRVKIEVLKDAAQKFYDSLFYCDGDTVFLKSPLELFRQVNDKTSLMHIAESKLGVTSNPLTKKIGNFVTTNKFFVPMNKETVMWNAGVIGISQNNKKLLPEIIKLTDEMFRKYPKHVMEQLAVSAVLQNHTHILAADQVIYHYWDQKDEFQKNISEYLRLCANDCILKFPQFHFTQRKAPENKSLYQRILDIFAN